MSKLAIEIWDKHIDVFNHFDLVCHNSHSLEEETKATALFSAIVTLESMSKLDVMIIEEAEIFEAIDYLKSSKYYSDANENSDH